MIAGVDMVVKVIVGFVVVVTTLYLSIKAFGYLYNKR